MSDSSKCRRHPNQKQLPGVCSSCLREKLSKLNTTSASFNNTSLVSHSSSLSSTPPYSSASSSSAAAGTTRNCAGNRHQRTGSEAAYVSVGMVLNDGLKKSRSVSCAPISRNKIDGCIKNVRVIGGVQEEQLQDGNLKKNKGGFLKRLIHSRSKKTNKGANLEHSKTTTTITNQN